MPERNDDFWGKPIFKYSRAQAIADGLLVDLTTATDENGQRLCLEFGFKVPVAITRHAWAKTIEAGGNWRPDGDGEVLELKGGQSLAGRLKDLLWMLRIACSGDPACSDRVHFEVRVDVHGDGRCEAVKLWALCGLGDDAEPVLTMMAEGED
jgi:hypothetical protein